MNMDDVNLYDQFKEHDQLQNEFEESENATKELSLRLLEAKDPQEVLNLFEMKYINGDRQ